MKRIGIVERSGRGVDKIYRGLLRFGRPVPDYSRSNDQQVVVGMPTSAADKAFLKTDCVAGKRRTGNASQQPDCTGRVIRTQAHGF